MLDSLMLSVSQRASLEQATSAFQKNVDSLESFLVPRGIERSAAVGSRLGRVSESLPGFERFVGWMSIPYCTQGGVVAMKFRCLDAHDCKAEGCQRYDAPSGQKARLYGAGELTKGGEMVAIVEGELKARVVTDVLGIPAVGTSAGVWRDHWSRCLADFDRKLIIADNDDPGLQHAKGKVLKAVAGAELIVPPSEHPKIDDWIVGVGPEEVRRAIGV